MRKERWEQRGQGRGGAIGEKKKKRGKAASLSLSLSTARARCFFFVVAAALDLFFIVVSRARNRSIFSLFRSPLLEKLFLLFSLHLNDSPERERGRSFALRGRRLQLGCARCRNRERHKEREIGEKTKKKLDLFKPSFHSASSFPLQNELHVEQERPCVGSSRPLSNLEMRESLPPTAP